MATAKKKTGTGSKRKVRKPTQQTGATHVREDKMHQAKKPGKRKSATGKVYYETRANRSDMGRLLGTRKKRGLGVATPLCVKQNPDRSSTIYSSSGGDNPCPRGGRIKAVAITLEPRGMTGTKSKKTAPATAKQKAAQAKFKVNSAKARQLVASGKAKNLKAAWAMLKKK